MLATLVDIWRARPEFPFDYARYGELLAVFSIAYAVSAPFMGWFLDRVGLTRGMCLSVAVWALASFGSAGVHSFERCCGVARCWAQPRRAVCQPWAR